MGLLDRLELLIVQRHDVQRRLERHGLRRPRLGDEPRQDLRVDGLVPLVEQALQNVGVAFLELEDAVLEDVVEEAQPAVLLDVEVEPGAARG